VTSLEEAIAASYSVTIEPQDQPSVVGRKLPADLQRLSPRERQILCLIVRGLRDREIADELVISTRTVTTMVTRILNKLETENHNRTSAAAYAVAQGLCDSD
jgi:two-component system NarL family response regulator